ncbi:MAG TPA: hypothetical protein VHB79_27700 [Polyangiaceae bacterium]|nr:hypothetical protein [Polyangiaceae bacterium]
MVVRVLGAAMLVGLGFLASCAGKSVDEGAGGAANDDGPSPVEQCQKYATTWCNKAFGCYVQVGRLREDELQNNVDQCIQLIEDKLPCSGVITVGDDYDKCLAQIKSMACSRWNVPETQFGTVTPPASCDNAVGF